MVAVVMRPNIVAIAATRSGRNDRSVRRNEAALSLGIRPYGEQAILDRRSIAKTAPCAANSASRLRHRSSRTA